MTRFALALVLLWIPTAHAADSYNSCKGFVDTLPATISSAGTWCLRRDLSTAFASGSAIDVTANNVTIDCNGFKIGGLGAGTATYAVGIRADDVLNATVRGCNIRGYLYGVMSFGGDGVLVEDNRFEGNTLSGVLLVGTGTIRRNLVLDSGGSTAPDEAQASGIYTNGVVDILDNTIEGVVETGVVTGITALANDGGEIAGNRIRQLASAQTFGVEVSTASRTVIGRNTIVGPAGYGVYCTSDATTVAQNVFSGITVPVHAACFASGNIVND